MKLTSVLGLSVCALAYAVPIEKRAADIELPAKRDDSTPVPPGGETVTFTPSNDGPLVDIAGLGPERENPDMIAEFSSTDLPAKRDDSTPVPPGGETVTFTPSNDGPLVDIAGLGPERENPDMIAEFSGTDLPAKRDDSTPVPPGGEIVTFTPSDDGPLVDIAGLGPERENPDMIAEFSGTDLPAKRDDSTPVPPGGKTVTFTPSGNSPVVELTGLGPQKEQPGIFAGVPGTDLPVQTKPDGVDVLAYDEPSH